MFGLPIRVGKTDTQDNERRKQMEEMMENMGSSLWSVIDPEDEVELVETKSTGQVDLFEKNLNYSNNEMSKVIIGSTSITDEKSFVGSAEVGERMFEQKQKSICRKIAFYVNNELIPRMVRYGLNLTGFTFKWINEDTVDVITKLEIVKTLSTIGKLDYDQLEETFGFKIEQKADPRDEIIKAQKSNLKELKAMYDHG